ncbi:MAG: hypothetical protein R8K50_03790 [Mariprofundus sp.]
MAIPILKRICRQHETVAAFNMLDARKFKPALLGEMQAHDSAEVLAFCRSITPDCQCRSDYLPDDFSIYMRRS